MRYSPRRWTYKMIKRLSERQRDKDKKRKTIDPGVLRYSYDHSFMVTHGTCSGLRIMIYRVPRVKTVRRDDIKIIHVWINIIWNNVTRIVTCAQRAAPSPRANELKPTSHTHDLLANLGKSSPRLNMHNNNSNMRANTRSAATMPEQYDGVQ